MADLTITINRSGLNEVMMGAVSVNEQIKDGKAKLKGDRKPFDELKTMLSTFTMAFELLLGTLPEKASVPTKVNPFKQNAPADSSGG